MSHVIKNRVGIPDGIADRMSPLHSAIGRNLKKKKNDCHKHPVLQDMLAQPATCKVPPTKF
jgi:hypothetical protein